MYKFLIAFLFICQFANAQPMITDNAGNEMGTSQEVNGQKGVMVKSRHGKLVQFIGYKAYYLNFIENYSEDYLKLSIKNQSMVKSKGITNMVKTIDTESPHTCLSFHFDLNKDDRITSLYITGEPYELIYLFLWYWPTTITAKPTAGKVYYEYLGDETITFNYSAKPSITITKRK